MVRSHQSFAGGRYHLIGACHVTVFAISELSATANRQVFVLGIMKLRLSFGLPHTIIVDTDNKVLVYFVKFSNFFFSTFTFSLVATMI